MFYHFSVRKNESATHRTHLQIRDDKRFAQRSMMTHATYRSLDNGCNARGQLTLNIAKADQLDMQGYIICWNLIAFE